LHSKVAFDSLLERVNVAVVLLVGPDGPLSMVVCGAWVSMVTVSAGEVPEMRPKALVACAVIE
jgi:hypothetical protein